MAISQIVKYTRSNQDPRHPSLLSFETKECDGVHEGLILIIPRPENTDFSAGVQAALKSPATCQVIHIKHKDLDKALVLTPSELQTAELTAILLPNTDPELNLSGTDLLKMAEKLFDDLGEKMDLNLFSRHSAAIDAPDAEPDADETARLTGSFRSARTSAGSMFGKFFRLRSSRSMASVDSDTTKQIVYINEISSEKLPGGRICPGCTIS